RDALRPTAAYVAAPLPNTIARAPMAPPPGAAVGGHVYKVSSRVRKDSTARTHASRASIIVQCPQLGNTCSSALGMSRIGRIAESTGLTRSSRPQVIRVGALIRANFAQ